MIMASEFPIQESHQVKGLYIYGREIKEEHRLSSFTQVLERRGGSLYDNKTVKNSFNGVCKSVDDVISLDLEKQHDMNNVTQGSAGSSCVPDDITNTCAVQPNAFEESEQQEVPRLMECTGGDDLVDINISNQSLTSRIFGIYQEGDGHLDDPDGIPTRYLVMARGHRAHAKKAFEATLQWRKDNDVDRILAWPHPKYDQVKFVFPHYFAGRDVRHNPVLVQRPGLLNKSIMHKLSLTHDDLMHQMIYTLEYCWNVIEPSGHNSSKCFEYGKNLSSINALPNYGVMTSVIDLKGLGLKTLRDGDTMAFVKRVLSIMSHHYPSRSYKTLLINTPRWFGTIYAILKPLLRESTREKIEILSSGIKQDDALTALLGSDVPRELLHDHDATGSLSLGNGATEQQAGPNSRMEVDMRDFCLQVLHENKMEMLRVIPTVINESLTRN